MGHPVGTGTRTRPVEGPPPRSSMSSLVASSSLLSVVLFPAGPVPSVVIATRHRAKRWPSQDLGFLKLSQQDSFQECLEVTSRRPYASLRSGLPSPQVPSGIGHRSPPFQMLRRCPVLDDTSPRPGSGLEPQSPSLWAPSSSRPLPSTLRLPSGPPSGVGLGRKRS